MTYVGPKDKTQVEISKLWSTISSLKGVTKNNRGRKPLELNQEESKAFHTLINRLQTDMKQLEWQMENDYFKPIDEITKLLSSRK